MSPCFFALKLRTVFKIDRLLLLLLALLLTGWQPANAEEIVDVPSPVTTTTAKELEDKPIKAPLTEVIGTAADALDHIPGSGRVVTQESIQRNQRLTVNEALREVPGVNVRDEDGFGLRPNIGIRGLNPTRSTKVHIMEDGVPIMLLPYGDPSSYYFPPLQRFDRIEVLKGSGQLLYGPQSIGGVINMITRMPPATPEGHFQLMGGNLSYLSSHFDYGGMWGKSGYMLDVNHYQGTTPRFFNQRAKVDDITFKTVQELSDRTTILAKFNYYREDSTIGYQGLTESQYATDAHRNDFNNDVMDFRRIGFHVAVNHMFNASLTSTTNFFGHYIDRVWGRQMIDSDGVAGSACTVSATGGVGGGCQTGNGLAAGVTQAIPANGRFINDRKYWVYGVEPRFHLTHGLFGIRSEADFGTRYMNERSQRTQFLNALSGVGTTCANAGGGQTGCLGENTTRQTNAFALFFQNRFFITDNFTITPGFRVEHVNYDQVDNRANSGSGAFSKTHITEVLPGIGATYTPIKNYTFFAGVHRGFAPPQISDAIQSNVVVDLDAELSWNYEIGIRGNPIPWAWFEMTGFRMDFENQIVNQSVAGGTGATNTNAGRTAHMGVEFGTKLDLLDAIKGQDPNEDITIDINYTWLGQAEFRGTRNSSITGAALLAGEAAAFNTNGNRLPYAPRNTVTAGIGYANRNWGFDGRVETQCISDMFGDDRNTYIPTPNGQRGIVKGWCVVNAAVNQYVKPIKTTFFLVGKNLFDQTFIVDRTRGIYPGLPLLVQGGARWTF
ncbi:MAG: TonB-dependent receptor [Nitrospira sp.]|nr:TonB-dependent receptor [Nitrospira sp.]